MQNNQKKEKEKVKIYKFHVCLSRLWQTNTKTVFLTLLTHLFPTFSQIFLYTTPLPLYKP